LLPRKKYGIVFVRRQSSVGGGKKHIVKQLRVNERIIAREVRLVGEKGEQLGIMTLAEAREVARKQMLDIVEVAPTSVPPVCRLLDYGKFKYEQAKKEQQARKNQKVSLLREVRLRPKIGLHDFEAKARTARKLLNEGDKVKLTLMFRGREATHPELGWKVLQRMVASLSDIAALEKQPVMEGKRMNIVLAPASTRAPAKTQATEGAKAPAPATAKAKVKEEKREVQHAETKNS
jgi:translation initiation factor IF-3